MNNNLDDLNKLATNNFWVRNVPTILSTVVVLAGFVSIGMYAYNASQDTKQEELPIIKAQSDIIKIKPSDPGGQSVPNMDKTVYENFAKNRQDVMAQAEQLAPQPEEPIDLNKVLGNQKNEEQSNDDIDNVLIETENVQEVAPAVIPEPAPAKPVELQPSAHDNTNKAEHVMPTEKPELVKKKAISVAPQEKKKAETKKLVEKKHHHEKHKIMSGYSVQLASLKSEAEAKSEWKHIAKRHHKLVSAYKHRIEKRDLGSEKGVFYRLHLGPLADAKAAKELCHRLGLGGQGCMVVKP